MNNALERHVPESKQLVNHAVRSVAIPAQTPFPASRLRAPRSISISCEPSECPILSPVSIAMPPCIGGESVSMQPIVCVQQTEGKPATVEDVPCSCSNSEPTSSLGSLGYSLQRTLGVRVSRSCNDCHALCNKESSTDQGTVMVDPYCDSSASSTAKVGDKSCRFSGDERVSLSFAVKPTHRRIGSGSLLMSIVGPHNRVQPTVKWTSGAE
jgi:hypothetical protein